MKTEFQTFIAYHRKLLVEGIKNHPEHFSKSDLKEFDVATLVATKFLKNQGLYEAWNPVFYLSKPMEFATLTEQQVLFKTYLEPLDGSNILLEAISEEIPADINAAIKSQIIAIKNLRKFYDGLEEEKKAEINEKAVDITKTRNTFDKELEDIEDEINGIYGKLEKGGALSKFAKKAFGGLQRAVGTVFGAGEVKKTSIKEHRRMLIAKYSRLNEDKAAAAELAVNSQVGRQVAAAIRDVMANNKQNLLTSGQVGDIINQFKGAGLTPNDIGNVAHSIGANVQGTLGTLSGGASAAAQAASTKGAMAAGSKAIAAGATGATGAAGTPGATSAAAGASKGKGILAAIKGGAAKFTMGVMAKFGLGALLAALVAAGAAGIKMKNRRLRINALQDLAKEYGAKIVFLKPNPLVENPPKAETKPAELPAGAAPAQLGSGGAPGGAPSGGAPQTGPSGGIGLRQLPATTGGDGGGSTRRGLPRSVRKNLTGNAPSDETEAKRTLGLKVETSNEEAKAKAEEVLNALDNERAELARATRNANKAASLLREQLKREIRKAVLQELKARRNR